MVSRVVIILSQGWGSSSRGAEAPEKPAELFKSSLGGSTRHAIDRFEGEDLDEDAFKVLMSAAATLHGA